MDELFGAPIEVLPSQRDEWLATLTTNWLTLMGRPVGFLAHDLADMGDVFAAGVSPRSIKERVYALPPASGRDRSLPGGMRLILDGCSVITPEGRIMLELLAELQGLGATMISRDQQLWALDTSSTIRSRWHEVWMRKQFESPLSPAALGAALFLLVNGSIGADRALTLPVDDDHDRELARIVLPILGEFSMRLGGKTPDDQSGLRKHWAFSQVTRLLGRDVARGRTPLGTLVFVNTGREAALLDQLDERISRIANAAQRGYAIDGFMERFRIARGALAARGLLYEDPTATRRIVSRLSGRTP